MTAQHSHALPASAQTSADPSRHESTWRPATRIAFRFGVVYLGLFCLATQISGSMIPNLFFSYRGLGRLWPMREVTHWTATSVIGVPFRLDDVSGGEPLFFWVQTCWILTVSVLAVGVWSLVDRRRRSYATAYGWFHLFVRLALAAQLVEYGMTKVIPTQFPAPALATLVTPVGELTLSALLWTSIGAVPSYEIFTGFIELLAGVLLLLPQTAAAGALIAMGALTQVFALNMAYDIGLKLTSLHLIALAVVLLAPDVPRLADFFLRRRLSVASTPPQLARTSAERRLLQAGQLAFGVYLLGTQASLNWSFWQVAGGGRPASALYGVWNVEELAVDGQIRPADLNDYDRRWRRVIFDAPDTVVVQRTDDSLARYGASLDPIRNVLTLSKGTTANWTARFTFHRPSPDRLVVEGVMDAHHVLARLRRVDVEAFPLLNSSFRWVRPHDP